MASAGALLFCLLLAGCAPRPLQFAGEAQGTTYHVTAVPAGGMDAAGLQQAVDRRLAAIDRALSGYRDDSAVSRFNRAPVGEWLEVDPDLYTVLKIGQRVSADSGGAFDVTVAPLVRLWGFGPNAGPERVPDAAAIAAARVLVGFERLQIDPERPRVKKLQPLEVDLNGIAQGYSVDQLAALLEHAGCRDYLVELGGELRLAGHSPRGGPWRIGIEKPDAGPTDAQQALVGSGIGVATSGDYHDYFEQDGVRYSHTIDPASGRPIAHKLASVTVVAPTTVLADAYGTALEVLGPQRGLALAERLHLAAYFIVRKDAGFTVEYSPEMRAYLPQ